MIVAAKNNQKNIILGAYGCGVFKNNPKDVAEYFKVVLKEEGYEKLFEKIVFAIYDKDNDKKDIFKKIIMY
jgi:uncharacterized protein (TIGR02452 family)